MFNVNIYAKIDLTDDEEYKIRDARDTLIELRNSIMKTGMGNEWADKLNSAALILDHTLNGELCN